MTFASLTFGGLPPFLPLARRAAFCAAVLALPPLRPRVTAAGFLPPTYRTSSAARAASKASRVSYAFEARTLYSNPTPMAAHAVKNLRMRLRDASFFAPADLLGVKSKSTRTMPRMPPAEWAAKPETRIALGNLAANSIACASLSKSAEKRALARLPSSVDFSAVTTICLFALSTPYLINLSAQVVKWASGMTDRRGAPSHEKPSSEVA